MLSTKVSERGKREEGRKRGRGRGRREEERKREEGRGKGVKRCSLIT
jgi:hypothetical protein